MNKHPKKLIYGAFLWATVPENVAVSISGPVQPKYVWWASLSLGVSQHWVMFAVMCGTRRLLESLGPTLWINSLLGERKVSLLEWKDQPVVHWAEKLSWPAGFVFMTKWRRFKWSLNSEPAQGPLSQGKETQHWWLCKCPSLLLLLLLFPGVQLC